MCTLAVAHRVVQNAPLVVGANREEGFARPSSPPQWHDAPVPWFGPRDERAGGTWIGINQSGLMVAVTNRSEPADGSRSRGRLVTDLLARSTVDASRSWLERKGALEHYAGFNLFVSDLTDAFVLEHGRTDQFHTLSPGVHVVVNAGFGASIPKSAIVAARLQCNQQMRLEPFLDRLGTCLRDHGLRTCIHGDDYGTVSSSLLSVTADRRLSYQFVDGPPCDRSHDIVCADYQLE